VTRRRYIDIHAHLGGLCGWQAWRPWEDVTNRFRRRFLHLAAGTVALPAVLRRARAQSYPTRPVQHHAGSPTDFGELIAAETEKWAKAIKFAGIRAG
jgi:hypothetical protein